MRTIYLLKLKALEKRIAKYDALWKKVYQDAIDKKPISIRQMRRNLRIADKYQSLMMQKLRIYRGLGV